MFYGSVSWVDYQSYSNIPGAVDSSHIRGLPCLPAPLSLHTLIGIMNKTVRLSLDITGLSSGFGYLSGFTNLQDELLKALAMRASNYTVGIGQVSQPGVRNAVVSDGTVVKCQTHTTAIINSDDRILKFNKLCKKFSRQENFLDCSPHLVCHRFADKDLCQFVLILKLDWERIIFSQIRH